MTQSDFKDFVMLPQWVGVWGCHHNQATSKTQVKRRRFNPQLFWCSNSDWVSHHPGALLLSPSSYPEAHLFSSSDFFKSRNLMLYY